jgi:hypothetical protein
VGLIDQLIDRGSFHAADPFLYQIDAQNWSFMVLNSLAKSTRTRS